MECTDLWCIRINRTVVDVHAKGNGTCKAKILTRSADLGVTEEKGHCNYRSNDHGSATTPAPARATHEPGQDWTKDAAEVVDGVVAPGDKCAWLPRTGTMRGEIGW